MDQETALPTRKVAAGGLAAALSIIIVWLLRFASIEVPGEVASAFTTVLGFATAYLVRERA